MAQHEVGAAQVGPVATVPVATAGSTPVAMGTPAASNVHGGVVREQTVGADQDGNSVLQRTYGDGTTIDVRHSVEDGKDVDTYAEPDGTQVVSSVGNGQGFQVDAEPDGDTVVTRWDFSTLTATNHHADGTQTDVAWQATNAHPPAGSGLYTSTSTDAAGQVTSTSSIQTTADGGARALTVDARGTATTVRLGVEEFVNGDGSLTRVYAYPDGATEAFTFDVGGAPVAHESHPALLPEAGPVVPSPEAAGDYHGGIVREEALPTLAGGSGLTRVVYGDGTTGLITHVTGPDGAPLDITTMPDGTVSTSSVHDGSGTATFADQDGTSVTQSWDFTQFQETAAGPHGTSQLSWLGAPSDAPAGTALYSADVTDPAGNLVTSTSVYTTPDGGAVASTIHPDGITTVRLEVARVPNPDGSVTTIYTAPDGSTEAFTANAQGAVVAHESHPGSDPSALPVAEPVPAAGDHHGGIVQEVPTEAQNGATSTTRVTYGDGTTATVDHYLSSDGQATEDIVRTGDGVLHSTLLAADGRSVSHIDTTTDPGTGYAIYTFSTGDAQARVFATDTETTLDWSGPAPGATATPGQQLWEFTTTGRPDGDRFIDTGYVSAGPQGTATSTTIAADGTITTTALDVATLHNPDGSVTTVYTHPDGATDAFTVDRVGTTVDFESHPGSDPGALPAAEPVAAAGYYRGGIVQEVPAEAQNGATSSTRVTFGDGTTATVDHYVDPESGAVQDDVRTADGMLHETVLLDGGRSVSHIDTTTETGSVLDTERTGDAQARVFGTDTTTTLDWSGPAPGAAPTPGQQLWQFTTTGRPDGDRFIDTGYVTATADGGAVVTTIDVDGTSTSVRVQVTDHLNPDGSTTHVFTRPDGSTDAFTVDSAGTTVDYESHPGTSALVGNAPVVGAAAPAAAALGTTTTTLTNGAVQTTEHPPQGGWARTTTMPDGRVGTMAVDQDGTITKSVTMPDHSSQTVSQTISGSKVVHAVGSDGRSVTVQTLPDGRQTQSFSDPNTHQTVIKADQPDGSTTQTTYRDDGTVKVTAAPNGGVVTTEASDAAGNTLVKHENPDGSWDSTTHVQAGDHVVEKTGNSAFTTTTDRAPDGSYTYEASGSDGSHTFMRIGNDKSGTTDLRAADGSRTIQVSAASGQSTTMSITPDGIRTTEVRTADGVLWQTGVDRIDPARPGTPLPPLQNTPEADAAIRARENANVVTTPDGERIGVVRQASSVDPLPTIDTTIPPDTFGGSGGQPLPAFGTSGDIPPDLLPGPSLGLPRSTGDVADQAADLAGQTAQQGLGLLGSLAGGTPAQVAGQVAETAGEQLGGLLQGGLPEIPDPSGLVPDPTSLVPDPTSLIPDPTSLIPDPTGLIPDPTSLIPDPHSIVPTETWSGGFSETWGMSGSTEGSTSAGPLQASGGASYDIAAYINAQAAATAGPDGVSAMAAAQGGITISGEAYGQADLGPASASGTAQGSAGAAGNAAVHGQAGLDGLGFGGSADAFAGSEGSAEVKAGLGGVATAGAGGGWSVGIGGHVGVDGELSSHRVGVSFDAGATFGIGGEVHIDLSVDPDKIVDGIGDTITDPIGAAGDVADWAGDTAGDAAHSAGEILEGIGDAGEQVAQVVSDIPEAASKVFSVVPDIAEGAGDLAQSGVSIAQDVVTGVVHVVDGGVTALVDAGEAFVDGAGDLLDDLDPF